VARASGLVALVSGVTDVAAASAFLAELFGQ
jgi:hypothetical protein